MSLPPACAIPTSRIPSKLQRMPPDAQEKVRAALTRILNEGDGGMICILL